MPSAFATMAQSSAQAAAAPVNLNDLSDEQLAAALAAVPDAKLRRVMDKMPDSKVRAFKSLLSKRKLTSEEPVTAEDARAVLIQLMAIERATGHPWRDFVKGWLWNNYEIQGNARNMITGSSLAQWQSGANPAQSTAECLVPKAGGKKPAKDGYVTFDIPSLWSDVLDKAGRNSLPSKMAAHRVVALASNPPPKSVDAAGRPITYEASHFCGNNFCVKHVGWEPKTTNQSRGPCFNYTNPMLKETVCPGHGGAFCIRRKECPMPDVVKQNTSDGAQFDTRSEVIAPLVSELLATPEAQRNALATWQKNLVKVGKGVTSLLKFFRLSPKESRAKEVYKARFAELSGLAARDTQRFEQQIQTYIVTPSPKPADLRAALGIS